MARRGNGDGGRPGRVAAVAIAAGAAAAAVVLCRAPAAAAFKYNLAHDTEVGTTQATLMLSEGHMFASHDGPFGTDGVSSISAGIRLTPAAGGTGSRSAAINLWAVHLDAETYSRVGYVVPDVDGGQMELLCCTPSLYAQRVCGAGTVVGGLIVHEDADAARKLAPALAVLTPNASYVDLAAVMEVAVAGQQYLVVAACDTSTDVPARGLPALHFDVDLAFINPAGYLPGAAYGLLPFYGTLFIAYTLLTAGYGAIAALKRRYLLRLQLAVGGVMLAGVVEMALFFFTYRSKNATGVPTPCSECGTPTSDYMAAVVWGVLKRAVSRGLLLAVAAGFGVVHPTLTRRTTAGIVALCTGYAVFGVVASMVKETTYDPKPNAWQLPVMMLDSTIGVLIYSSLISLRRMLATTGQTAKLAMYTKLMWVLVANLTAWFLFAIIFTFIRMRFLPLTWSWLFLLDSCWDILYFVILAAVAIIWLPGEEAFQYAWYSQGSSTDDGAVGGGAMSGGGLGNSSSAGTEESVTATGASTMPDGVELTSLDVDSEFHHAATRNAVASGARGAGGRAPPSDAFVITAEDDDDDDGGETRPPTAPAPPAPARVAAAPTPVRSAAAAAATSPATPGHTTRGIKLKAPRAGPPASASSAAAPAVAAVAAPAPAPGGDHVPLAAAAAGGEVDTDDLDEGGRGISI